MHTHARPFVVLALASILFVPCHSVGEEAKTITPKGLSDEAAIWKGAKFDDTPKAIGEFLVRHTGPDADLLAMPRLVARLGSVGFAEREDAARRLTALGPAAVSVLRDALKHKDPEVVDGAKTCLGDIAKTAETHLI